MRYVAKIYRKTKNGYVEVKSVNFKPDDKIVPYKSHKNRSYLVNLTAISHETAKGDKVLCFDYDTGDILSFNKVNTPIPPEDADALVFHSIIGALLSRVFNAMQTSDKGKFLAFVLVFIVGCVLGWFACSSMTASQVAQQAQGVATVSLEGLKHVGAVLLQ